MAQNIGAIREGVQSRIKDGAPYLTAAEAQGDLDRAIASAVEQYSKDRPRNRTAQADGTGAFDYLLATVAPGYDEAFSNLLDVVYPWLVTDQRLNVLEKDSWVVIMLPAGLTLKFLDVAPTASQDFLVLYTCPHTLTVAASSIPPSDDEAVKDLSAAYALDAMAAYFLQLAEASITADSVDRRSRSDQARSVAEVYRKRYAQKIQAGGVGAGGDGGTRAAQAVGEIQSAFGNRLGTDYHFHGRR